MHVCGAFPSAAAAYRERESLMLSWASAASRKKTRGIYRRRRDSICSSWIIETRLRPNNDTIERGERLSWRKRRRASEALFNFWRRCIVPFHSRDERDRENRAFANLIAISGQARTMPGIWWSEISYIYRDREILDWKIFTVCAMRKRENPFCSSILGITCNRRILVIYRKKEKSVHAAVISDETSHCNKVQSTRLMHFIRYLHRAFAYQTHTYTYTQREIKSENRDRSNKEKQKSREREREKERRIVICTHAEQRRLLRKP